MLRRSQLRKSSMSILATGPHLPLVALSSRTCVLPNLGLLLQLGDVVVPDGAAPEDSLERGGQALQKLEDLLVVPAELQRPLEAPLHGLLEEAGEVAGRAVLVRRVVARRRVVVLRTPRARVGQGPSKAPSQSRARVRVAVPRVNVGSK